MEQMFTNDVFRLTAIHLASLANRLHGMGIGMRMNRSGKEGDEIRDRKMGHQCKHDGMSRMELEKFETWN